MHPRLSIYNGKAYFDVSESGFDNRTLFLIRWYFFFSDGTSCMLGSTSGVKVVRLKDVPTCIVERDSKYVWERRPSNPPRPTSAPKVYLVFRVYLPENQFTISHDNTAEEVLKTLSSIASASSLELARKIFSLVISWELQEQFPLCD